MRPEVAFLFTSCNLCVHTSEKGSFFLISALPSENLVTVFTDSDLPKSQNVSSVF